MDSQPKYEFPSIHVTKRPNPPSLKPPFSPWKKLLYLQQPYPDNYTDVSFLSQLKRNTTVAKHNYINLVADFSLIVFHLANLFLVLLVFIGVYLYQWNLFTPLLISSVISITGLIILQSENLKSYFIIIVMLLIASPVLKSLTRSTASDSIWALSFMLFVANTLFHDYAMSGNEYKPILSTNISLSNAIVLASRLNSNSQVFLFVLFAIQMNILLPLFDVVLRRSNYIKLHGFLFFVLYSIVSVLFYRLLGLKVLFLWWVCSASIMFVLPAYYLFLQRYKNELQGPWDTAKPVFNSTPSP